ncbi:type II toxin-antitoxin system RatA family toxin [Polymorphobacter fuscus]|uniref:Type II toxin-antitoxin system RatA family toxin n=1 Tax=Sandarakinorhabdus fusca TaxID=1439888 RepID=A0A7C9GU02_9SPHN|nr:type II toxin-antitoxin system RatA family toxin [Polymorphobacter fuscus]KAB7648865.1 type II toxin-antitoxin system RatA family toxin [Polymorphobacter fuscus]MQT16449.1 type II toxin-antitoxin system RatA family toxin [Polymorphobacter fuscus]NJC07261.1 coenzyme Q-binding protein COQ10 [Polymorphobacter fuscus]
MPRHSETRHLAWSQEQMFDLVADVAKYDDFLPWVQAMRIRSHEGNVVTADMVVGFKMVRERFTSRVTLDRPKQVHVDYISGPLKYLKNDWVFRAADDGGCEIDFCVDFEFNNRMFERLAGMFFSEAFKRMVGAFETRAAAVYGPPGSAPPVTAPAAPPVP